MQDAQPPTASKTCTWQIQCGGSTRSFTLFDTPMGRSACQLVLSGKSYPILPTAGVLKTIVDIGANVGAATVYFASQYPAAQILAFEPSPTSFALLIRNTADLPQVRPFPFGLIDRDVQTVLYHGREDAVCDSIGQSREQTSEGTPITLRAAGQALKEAQVDQIDILKLDTEGCEVPILRSLNEFLPRTGVIYVEFHSERDRLEIDRLLLPTHALFRAEIARSYRGELCYVSRQCLPASIEQEAEIRLSSC
jgi:FkbM family methyltransferase